MKNNVLENLSLPLRYSHGQIVDAADKVILKAERDGDKTPLMPAGRDAMLKLACELINRSFEYSEANQILTKLGY